MEWEDTLKAKYYMEAQNPSAWSSHWLLSVINWKESLAPSSILALEFIIMQRVLKEGGGV